MVAMLGGGVFQTLWMATIQRMLGDADMGVHMPLVNLFYLLAPTACLGIPQTICTFVSHHYENDFDEARRFLSDGIRLMFMISIGIIIATVVVTIPLSMAGRLSWMSTVTALVLMVSVSATMMFWGVNSILNGFQRLELTSVGNFVYPIGIFLGAWYFIALAQRLAGEESRWDVVAGIAGLFCGHFVALLLALLIVKKMNVVSIGDMFNLRKNFGLYGKILKFGGVTALAMIFVGVIQQATPVIVRWIAPAVAKLLGTSTLLFATTVEANDAAIGHFSTAIFYGMTTMLVTGIAIAVMPAISEAESQGRKDLMQHYFSSALNQSFTIFIGFIIVYFIYIGQISELMGGEEFPAEVMHNLGVLSVFGGSGAALLFVIIHLFTGLKRPIIPAVVLGIVLILLTGGTIAFSIVFRDTQWACAGLIISTWIGVFILLILAKRVFDLSTEPWTFMEPLIAALPGLLFVQFVMPKTLALLSIGPNLVILLGPYALLIWLFSKRRTDPKLPTDGALAA